MNIDNDRIAARLPTSINRKNLNEVAQTVDEALRKINTLSELTLLYPRIEDLPSDIVDALARSLHVDFYDDSLPLDIKRALVKNSTRWHMRKGTKGIVAEMVETVWGGCKVEEWFEYNGQPFHFRVINITANHVDEDVINMVLRAINMTKNVRSWLDEIWFLRRVDVSTYYAVLPSWHKTHIAGPNYAKDTNLGITAYLNHKKSIHKNYVAGPIEPVGGNVDIATYMASIEGTHKVHVAGPIEPVGGNVDIAAYMAGIEGTHKVHVAGPIESGGGSVSVVDCMTSTESIHKTYVNSPRQINVARAETMAYTGSLQSCHKKIVLGKNEE